jgi:hypothetical protein
VDAPGGTDPVGAGPVDVAEGPVAVGTTLDVEGTSGPAASGVSSSSAPNVVHATNGTTMATPSTQ